MEIKLPDIPQSYDLKHIDEDGRPKITPPSEPEEDTDLDTSEVKRPILRPNQRQMVAKRQLIGRLKGIKSESAVERYREKADKLPERDRGKFIAKLDKIKSGIDNTRNLKRLLQVRKLQQMTRS